MYLFELNLIENVSLYHGVCLFCYDLTVHHCSALSLKGYPGLDGAKGETGAVGSKVHFYCFYPPVHLVLIVVKKKTKKKDWKTYSTLFSV